jgi:phosphoglycerol transferase
MGLYPLVMADEWVYSLYSRLLPFSQSSIPSYLFFWIYRQTNHSGASFTDCANLFNCIFVVSAAPLIYAISREFVGSTYAAFLALIIIASPANSYTAYFMPESMYYFGFWLLSWLVMGGANIAPLSRAVLIGMTLAGLSMVKVHAIFLLPGVCVAISARYLTTAPRRKLSMAMTAVICIVIAAVLMRLAAGYLFAGQAGIHILGQKYGAVTGSPMQVESSKTLTKDLLFVLTSHLTALALLFGVPLASLLAWSRADDSIASRSLYVLRIYTVSVIVFLLFVTTYYTVSVAPQAHESLGRLHFRYYNFALPLLLIIAAGEWRAANRLADWRRRIVIAIVIGALAVYAAFTLKAQHVQNIADSPELWSFFASRAALYAVACVNLSVLGVWVWNQRRGAGLFLFVAVPFTIVLSGWLMTPAIRGRVHSDTYEQAAQAARQIVGVRERSNLAVVGSDEVDLYRALYQIDSAQARMLVLPAHAALNNEQIQAKDTWLLVVGDHEPPKEFVMQFSWDGYALFRRAASTY